MVNVCVRVCVNINIPCIQRMLPQISVETGQQNIFDMSPWSLFDSRFDLKICSGALHGVRLFFFSPGPQSLDVPEPFSAAHVDRVIG